MRFLDYHALKKIFSNTSILSFLSSIFQSTEDKMVQDRAKVKKWRDRSDSGLSVDDLAILIRRAQPKVEKNNE